MKRTAWIPCIGVLILLLAPAGYSLDVTTTMDVSDRAYFRYSNDATAARIHYGVTVSQALPADLFLSLSAWNSIRADLAGGGTFLPEESDYAATVAYYGSLVSCGLTGTAFASQGAVHELGAFLDVTPPLPLEIVALLLELSVSSDFLGIYGELKIVPSVTMPWEVPVQFSLDATLEALAAGFRGTSVNGLAGLSLTPKVRVFLHNGASFSLCGGYFLSFSGEFAGYPSLQLGVVIPSAVGQEPQEG